MNYQKVINIWDTITCRSSLVASEMAGHIPAIAHLSDLLPKVDYDTIIDIYQEIRNIDNDAIVEIPSVADLVVISKGQEPILCVGVTFNNGTSMSGGNSSTVKITEVLRDSYEIVFKKGSSQESTSTKDTSWYYRYINLSTQHKLYV